MESLRKHALRARSRAPIDNCPQDLAARDIPAICSQIALGGSGRFKGALNPIGAAPPKVNPCICQPHCKTTPAQASARSVAGETGRGRHESHAGADARLALVQGAGGTANNASGWRACVRACVWGRAGARAGGRAGRQARGRQGGGQEGRQAGGLLGNLGDGSL